MWREWTGANGNLPRSLIKVGIASAVLGLSALIGGGRFPFPSQLLLTALMGGLLLLVAARRIELGLAAVLLSFLVGISVFSIGSLSLSVTFLLVLGLAGVWVLRQTQAGKLRVDAPGLQPLILWVIVGIISVAYSYVAWDLRVRGDGQSWAEGHRWIGYQLSALAGPIFTTCAYVLAVNGIRSRRWLTVLWTVAIGILVYLITPPLWTYLQRPFLPWQVGSLTQFARAGTAGVPEMYLALLALGLLLFDRNMWRRVAWTVLFVSGVVGVFAAYYLNTWLGLVGGSLIIIWQRSPRLFALCLAGFVLLGLVLSPIVGDIIAHRVSSSGDLLRLTIWDTGLDIWETSPLLGVGPGNLPSYMLAFSPLPWDWVQRGQFYAHNVYLTILTETGVIGLICVLWFIGSYLKALWGWTWNCKDEWLAGISAGGMGLFVANMFTGLVAGGLFAVSSGALFSVSGYAFNWVMFGAAIAAMRISSKQSQT